MIWKVERNIPSRWENCELGRKIHKKVKKLIWFFTGQGGGQPPWYRHQQWHRHWRVRGVWGHPGLLHVSRDLHRGGLCQDWRRGDWRGAGHAGPRLRADWHQQAGLPGVHVQGPGRGRGQGARGGQWPEIVNIVNINFIGSWVNTLFRKDDLLAQTWYQEMAICVELSEIVRRQRKLERPYLFCGFKYF